MLIFEGVMTASTYPTIRAGIVGATGYTGVELLRLLGAHPAVEIRAVTSRTEQGMPVAEMFPNLRGHVDAVFQTPDEAALDECDVVFFATPHEVAMQQARQLVDQGIKVIDLAADFRLQETAVFEQWYKLNHACTDVISEAVYMIVEMRHMLLLRETVRDCARY